MATNLDVRKIDGVGDLAKGRPTLGDMMSIAIYRMVIDSIKTAMIKECGVEKTAEIIYRAGEHAGKGMYAGFLRNVKSEEELFEKIRDLFLVFKIGYFEVVSKDDESREFMFDISEDLDCSGLPEDGSTKCIFDEGLISGILFSFYGRHYITHEISCWGTGEESCVFKSVSQD
ncbi:hypothetical protein LLH00_01850 [bacterium]|nr:hypothetical protein [bacterium]